MICHHMFIIRTCMLIIDKKSESWVSLSDNIQRVIGVEIPKQFQNTYHVTITKLWVKSWMIHVNSQMYKTRDGGCLNNHTSLWQNKLRPTASIQSHAVTQSLGIFQGSRWFALWLGFTVNHPVLRNHYAHYQVLEVLHSYL